MDINFVTIQLAVLFFPGIVTQVIINLITKKERDTAFIFLMNSFLLSFLDYLLFAIIGFCLNFFLGTNINTDFLNTLANGEFSGNYLEIIFVSFIGFGVGLFISKLISKNWLYPLLVKAGFTNKISSRPLWEDLMHRDGTGWIRLLDFENSLIYEGWINYYDNDGPELLLKDVKVYTDSGDKLYEVPAIYINRINKNIIVEFTNYND
jgi:hypothetical protein